MDEIARNLAAVEQWAEAFNDDVDRLVTDLYAPDCVILTWRDGKVIRDDTYTDTSRWPGAT